MQERLEKKRRNLILVAAISIFVCYAEVSISGLNINGLALVVVGRENAIIEALIVLLFYFYVAFMWHLMDYGDENLSSHYKSVSIGYLNKEALFFLPIWSADRNSGGNKRVAKDLIDNYSSALMNDRNSSLRRNIYEEIQAATRNGRSSIFLDNMTPQVPLFFDPKHQYKKAKIKALIHILLRTSLFVDYVVPFAVSSLAMAMLFKYEPVSPVIQPLEVMQDVEWGAEMDVDNIMKEQGLTRSNDLHN